MAEEQLFPTGNVGIEVALSMDENDESISRIEYAFNQIVDKANEKLEKKKIVLFDERQVLAVEQISKIIGALRGTEFDKLGDSFKGFTTKVADPTAQKDLRNFARMMSNIADSAERMGNMRISLGVGGADLSAKQAQSLLKKGKDHVDFHVALQKSIIDPRQEANAQALGSALEKLDPQKLRDLKTALLAMNKIEVGGLSEIVRGIEGFITPTDTAAESVRNLIGEIGRLSESASGFKSDNELTRFFGGVTSQVTAAKSKIGEFISAMDGLASKKFAMPAMPEPEAVTREHIINAVQQHAHQQAENVRAAQPAPAPTPAPTRAAAPAGAPNHQTVDRLSNPVLPHADYDALLKHFAKVSGHEHESAEGQRLLSALEDIIHQHLPSAIHQHAEGEDTSHLSGAFKNLVTQINDLKREAAKARQGQDEGDEGDRVASQIRIVEELAVQVKAAIDTIDHAIGLSRSTTAAPISAKPVAPPTPAPKPTPAKPAAPVPVPPPAKPAQASAPEELPDHGSYNRAAREKALERDRTILANRPAPAPIQPARRLPVIPGQEWDENTDHTTGQTYDYSHHTADSVDRLAQQIAEKKAQLAYNKKVYDVHGDFRRSAGSDAEVPSFLAKAMEEAGSSSTLRGELELLEKDHKKHKESLDRQNKEKILDHPWMVSEEEFARTIGSFHGGKPTPVAEESHANAVRRAQADDQLRPLIPQYAAPSRPPAPPKPTQAPVPPVPANAPRNRANHRALDEALKSGNLQESAEAFRTLKDASSSDHEMKREKPIHGMQLDGILPQEFMDAVDKLQDKAKTKGKETAFSSQAKKLSEAIHKAFGARGHFENVRSGWNEGKMGSKESNEGLEKLARELTAAEGAFKVNTHDEASLSPKEAEQRKHLIGLVDQAFRSLGAASERLMHGHASSIGRQTTNMLPTLGFGPTSNRSMKQAGVNDASPIAGVDMDMIGGWYQPGEKHGVLNPHLPYYTNHEDGDDESRKRMLNTSVHELGHMGIKTILNKEERKGFLLNWAKEMGNLNVDRFHSMSHLGGEAIQFGNEQLQAQYSSQSKSYKKTPAWKDPYAMLEEAMVESFANHMSGTKSFGNVGSLDENNPFVQLHSMIKTTIAKHADPNSNIVFSRVLGDDEPLTPGGGGRGRSKGDKTPIDEIVPAPVEQEGKAPPVVKPNPTTSKATPKTPPPPPKPKGDGIDAVADKGMFVVAEANGSNNKAQIMFAPGAKDKDGKPIMAVKIRNKTGQETYYRVNGMAEARARINSHDSTLMKQMDFKGQGKHEANNAAIAEAKSFMDLKPSEVGGAQMSEQAHEMIDLGHNFRLYRGQTYHRTTDAAGNATMVQTTPLQAARSKKITAKQASEVSRTLAAHTRETIAKATQTPEQLREAAKNKLRDKVLASKNMSGLAEALNDYHRETNDVRGTLALRDEVLGKLEAKSAGGPGIQESIKGGALQGATIAHQDRARGQNRLVSTVKNGSFHAVAVGNMSQAHNYLAEQGLIQAIKVAAERNQKAENELFEVIKTALNPKSVEELAKAVRQYAKSTGNLDMAKTLLNEGAKALKMSGVSGFGDAEVMHAHGQSGRNTIVSHNLNGEFNVEALTTEQAGHRLHRLDQAYSPEEARENITGEHFRTEIGAEDVNGEGLAAARRAKAQESINTRHASEAATAQEQSDAAERIKRKAAEEASREMRSQESARSAAEKKLANAPEKLAYNATQSAMSATTAEELVKAVKEFYEITGHLANSMELLKRGAQHAGFDVRGGFDSEHGEHAFVAHKEGALKGQSTIIATTHNGRLQVSPTSPARGANFLAAHGYSKDVSEAKRGIEDGDSKAVQETMDFLYQKIDRKAQMVYRFFRGVDGKIKYSMHKLLSDDGAGGVEFEQLPQGKHGLALTPEKFTAIDKKTSFQNEENARRAYQEFHNTVTGAANGRPNAYGIAAKLTRGGPLGEEGHGQIEVYKNIQGAEEAYTISMLENGQHRVIMAKTEIEMLHQLAEAGAHLSEVEERRVEVYKKNRGETMGMSSFASRQGHHGEMGLEIARAGLPTLLPFRFLNDPIARIGDALQRKAGLSVPFGPKFSQVREIQDDEGNRRIEHTAITRRYDEHAGHYVHEKVSALFRPEDWEGMGKGAQEFMNLDKAVKVTNKGLVEHHELLRAGNHLNNTYMGSISLLVQEMMKWGLGYQMLFKAQDMVLGSIKAIYEASKNVPHQEYQLAEGLNVINHSGNTNGDQQKAASFYDLSGGKLEKAEAARLLHQGTSAMAAGGQEPADSSEVLRLLATGIRDKEGNHSMQSALKNMGNVAKFATLHGLDAKDVAEHLNDVGVTFGHSGQDQSKYLESMNQHILSGAGSFTAKDYMQTIGDTSEVFKDAKIGPEMQAQIISAGLRGASHKGVQQMGAVLRTTFESLSNHDTNGKLQDIVHAKYGELNSASPRKLFGIMVEEMSKAKEDEEQGKAGSASRSEALMRLVGGRNKALTFHVMDELNKKFKGMGVSAADAMEQGIVPTTNSGITIEKDFKSKSASDPLVQEQLARTQLSDVFLKMGAAAAPTTISVLSKLTEFFEYVNSHKTEIQKAFSAGLGFFKAIGAVVLGMIDGMTMRSRMVFGLYNKQFGGGADRTAAELQPGGAAYTGEKSKEDAMMPFLTRKTNLANNLPDQDPDAGGALPSFAKAGIGLSLATFIPFALKAHSMGSAFHAETQMMRAAGEKTGMGRTAAGIASGLANFIPFIGGKKFAGEAGERVAAEMRANARDEKLLKAMGHGAEAETEEKTSPGGMIGDLVNAASGFMGGGKNKLEEGVEKGPGFLRKERDIVGGAKAVYESGHNAAGAGYKATSEAVAKLSAQLKGLGGAAGKTESLFSRMWPAAVGLTASFWETGKSLVGVIGEALKTAFSRVTWGTIIARVLATAALAYYGIKTSIAGNGAAQTTLDTTTEGKSNQDTAFAGQRSDNMSKIRLIDNELKTASGPQKEELTSFRNRLKSLVDAADAGGLTEDKSGVGKNMWNTMVSAFGSQDSTNAALDTKTEKGAAQEAAQLQLDREFGKSATGKTIGAKVRARRGEAEPGAMGADGKPKNLAEGSEKGGPVLPPPTREIYQGRATQAYAQAQAMQGLPALYSEAGRINPLQEYALALRTKGTMEQALRTGEMNYSRAATIGKGSEENQNMMKDWRNKLDQDKIQLEIFNKTQREKAFTAQVSATKGNMAGVEGMSQVFQRQRESGKMTASEHYNVEAALTNEYLSQAKKQEEMLKTELTRAEVAKNWNRYQELQGSLLQVQTSELEKQNNLIKLRIDANAQIFQMTSKLIDLQKGANTLLHPGQEGEAMRGGLLGLQSKVSGDEVSSILRNTSGMKIADVDKEYGLTDKMASQIGNYGEIGEHAQSRMEHTMDFPEAQNGLLESLTGNSSNKEALSLYQSIKEEIKQTATLSFMEQTHRKGSFDYDKQRLEVLKQQQQTLMAMDQLQEKSLQIQEKVRATTSHSVVGGEFSANFEKMDALKTQRDQGTRAFATILQRGGFGDLSKQLGGFQGVNGAGAMNAQLAALGQVGGAAGQSIQEVSGATGQMKSGAHAMAAHAAKVYNNAVAQTKRIMAGAQTIASAEAHGASNTQAIGNKFGTGKYAPPFKQGGTLGRYSTQTADLEAGDIPTTGSLGGTYGGGDSGWSGVGGGDGSGGYSDPLGGAGPVTQAFGVHNAWDGKNGHGGVDRGIAPGHPVNAAMAGTVTFAGLTPGGFGNLVIIDHGNGYESYYGHLSKISVSKGQKVSNSTNIGLSGGLEGAPGSGDAKGAGHLHFEVRFKKKSVNPDRLKAYAAQHAIQPKMPAGDASKPPTKSAGKTSQHSGPPAPKEMSAAEVETKRSEAMMALDLAQKGLDDYEGNPGPEDTVAHASALDAVNAATRQLGALPKSKSETVVMLQHSLEKQKGRLKGYQNLLVPGMDAGLANDLKVKINRQQGVVGNVSKQLMSAVRQAANPMAAAPVPQQSGPPAPKHAATGGKSAPAPQASASGGMQAKGGQAKDYPPPSGLPKALRNNWDLIVSQALGMGLSPYWFASQLLAEDRSGDPNAVSPVGAIGLAQLMPGTARDLGVRNPRDPRQAIIGAAKYMKQLHGDAMGKKLSGDKAWQWAFRGYNGGPGWEKTAKYSPENMLYNTAISKAHADFFGADHGGVGSGANSGPAGALDLLHNAQDTGYADSANLLDTQASMGQFGAQAKGKLAPGMQSPTEIQKVAMQAANVKPEDFNNPQIQAGAEAWGKMVQKVTAYQDAVDAANNSLAKEQEILNAMIDREQLLVKQAQSVNAIYQHRAEIKVTEAHETGDLFGEEGATQEERQTHFQDIRMRLGENTFQQGLKTQDINQTTKDLGEAKGRGDVDATARLTDQLKANVSDKLKLELDATGLYDEAKDAARALTPLQEAMKSMVMQLKDGLSEAVHSFVSEYTKYIPDLEKEQAKLTKTHSQEQFQDMFMAPSQGMQKMRQMRDYLANRRQEEHNYSMVMDPGYRAGYTANEQMQELPGKLITGGSDMGMGAIAGKLSGGLIDLMRGSAPDDLGDKGRKATGAEGEPGGLPGVMQTIMDSITGQRGETKDKYGQVLKDGSTLPDLAKATSGLAEVVEKLRVMLAGEKPVDLNGKGTPSSIASDKATIEGIAKSLNGGGATPATDNTGIDWATEGNEGTYTDTAPSSPAVATPSDTGPIDWATVGNNVSDASPAATPSTTQNDGGVTALGGIGSLISDTGTSGSPQAALGSAVSGVSQAIGTVKSIGDITKSLGGLGDIGKTIADAGTNLSTGVSSLMSSPLAAAGTAVAAGFAGNFAADSLRDGMNPTMGKNQLSREDSEGNAGGAIGGVIGGGLGMIAGPIGAAIGAAAGAAIGNTIAPAIGKLIDPKGAAAAATQDKMTIEANMRLQTSIEEQVDVQKRLIEVTANQTRAVQFQGQNFSNLGDLIRPDVHLLSSGADLSGRGGSDNIEGMHIQGGAQNLSHFAEGGGVGGVGNTDSVKAMLMPGEFVVRKDQAMMMKNAGVIQGNSLNMDALLPHYAGGGFIGNVLGGIGSFFGGIGSAISHVFGGGSSSISKIISNNGGSLIGEKGAGIISNNGGSVISNNGGRVISPNGGNILSDLGGEIISNNGGSIYGQGINGIISNNGGSVISPNGGNVISPNGGNIISEHGAGIISNNGGSVISPNGGNIISEHGAGIISNNGGSVISPNGGNIISEHGAGVISNNGGSVISPNGGNVISPNGGNLISDNGGGIISNNGGSFHFARGGFVPGDSSISRAPAPVFSAYALGRNHAAEMMQMAMAAQHHGADPSKLIFPNLKQQVHVEYVNDGLDVSPKTQQVNVQHVPAGRGINAGFGAGQDIFREMGNRGLNA